ncbi:hypothetical protein [Leptolyngbya phage Lbo-JY46]
MKNIDYIIKKLAKEKNIPEKVVESVYKFYWKKGVFDNLRNYNHIALSMPKIGTFHISYVKIRSEILEIIKRIKRVKKSDTLSEDKKNESVLYYKAYLKQLLQRRKDLLPEYTETLKKLKDAGKLKGIH